MAAQTKQEVGTSMSFVKTDPDIKEHTVVLSDEDIYEDTGDLDFSQAGQNVWLTRIPKVLWEHWSKLDDDEEIRIGTVRVEGDPTDIKRVSLRLDAQPENQDLPKDYVLKRQNVNADNTSFAVQNSYVFTERDIPGHKNRLDVLFGEARSALYESMKREAKKKAQKKKWEPYVRKTIPKHTAIVGKVRDEFNCAPVENEEFRQISEARALEALKPRRETRFVERFTGNMLQPKTVVPGDKGAFVQATRPQKLRPQENKSTRMPQNELLDLIYGCFREYKYWPFKALKAKLRQPEAYLKQTLEMVAHLVKSGDFSMTWELKPEARESNYANAMYKEAKAELAPDTGYNFDEASEEDPTASGVGSDNDDVQFESVV
jgi:transcription initiation factor TFIIF subunit beta